MIRIVIENLLLFLLPTLIYAAYVLLVRKPKRGGAAVLDEAPLVWLVLAGALLVVVVLATFGGTSGGRPGQIYHPPEMKDGHVEPGRLE